MFPSSGEEEETPTVLDPLERHILDHWTTYIGGSVKLLLAFAITVIPGFSRLEIRDQDFYCLLNMYVFKIGPHVRSVILYRRYICCTVISARAYPPCHGVLVTVYSIHPLSLQNQK
jgi:hypothetical protein